MQAYFIKNKTMFRQIFPILLCFLIIPSFCMEQRRIEQKSNGDQLPGIKKLFKDDLAIKWQCPPHDFCATNNVTSFLNHLRRHHRSGSKFKCPYYPQCLFTDERPSAVMHHLANKKEGGHNAFTICCKKMWVI